MSSAAQRTELQSKIWKIANDVRGSVDGWDFKQYVLGTLFYRFISENFSNYIEGGDESIKYAELDDSIITKEIKEDAIKTKGYFIYPSQLFANIAKNANTNDSLNTELKTIFDAIESSANGFPSEQDIKGLFADFDTTSNRLGNTVKDKNSRLAAVTATFFQKSTLLSVLLLYSVFDTSNNLLIMRPYHGLIQAFSRTNRIYDSTKTFGNIVTFRDLEKATVDAITLFGDTNTKNVVLEKSYKEYMQGFTDIATGEARRGYVEIVKELNERFPNIDDIVTEKDKKDFSKLFGEYLRVENILQNYDEFANLKALQSVDMQDPKAVEAFKSAHYVSDEEIAAMQKIAVPEERIIQDYRSTYNDIRDWLRKENAGKEKEKSSVDWDDVVFEVDLLKSQEINLDYILELIFEKNKKLQNKKTLVEDVRRLIRSSVGNRAKESLVVDFINQTDLDKIEDKASIIDAFFSFAQAEQRREAEELIHAEELNQDAARRYILASLKKE